MQQVFKNFLEPNAAGNEITPDMVRNEIQVNMDKIVGSNPQLKKELQCSEKKTFFFGEKDEQIWKKNIKDLSEKR